MPYSSVVFLLTLYMIGALIRNLVRYLAIKKWFGAKPGSWSAYKFNLIRLILFLERSASSLASYIVYMYSSQSLDIALYLVMCFCHTFSIDFVLCVFEALDVWSSYVSLPPLRKELIDPK